MFDEKPTIHKVTAFITRAADLLLIAHPHAGNQLPAGTVERGEEPIAAALREAFEETGLTITSTPIYLGTQETILPVDEAIILPPATVYARPNVESFDWTVIRSGVRVQVLRREQGFTQISYVEHDQLPNPNYITMQITGWVQDGSLAGVMQRHFYHLPYEGVSQPRWTVQSDHHTFTLFWAPRNDLPPLISPQDRWLDYLLA
ncbi:MAG: NUDIX domain-containing protein [Caldilineaceae bacterium]